MQCINLKIHRTVLLGAEEMHPFPHFRRPFWWLMDRKAPRAARVWVQLCQQKTRKSITVRRRSRILKWHVRKLISTWQHPLPIVACWWALLANMCSGLPKGSLWTITAFGSGVTALPVLSATLGSNSKCVIGQTEWKPLKVYPFLSSLLLESAWGKKGFRNFFSSFFKNDIGPAVGFLGS